MNLSNYVYMGYGAVTGETRSQCWGLSRYYDDASGQCFESADEYANWALIQGDKCKAAGSPSPFFDVNTAHCVATSDGTPVVPVASTSPLPPGSTADTGYLWQWGVILLVVGGIAYATVGKRGMRG